MSSGQVEEWLHADRGSPWKKAGGGEIMDVAPGMAPPYFPDNSSSEINYRHQMVRDPRDWEMMVNGDKIVSRATGPGVGSREVNVPHPAPIVTHGMAMGGSAPLGDPYREPNYDADPDLDWEQRLQLHRRAHGERNPEGEKGVEEFNQHLPMRQHMPVTEPVQSAFGGSVDRALRSADHVVRQHFQFGGMGMPMSQAIPWFARAAAREDIHDAGLLQSEIPGRTDHIPVSVAAGSYVVPADVVAGMGEGNSLAGARVLNHALGIGPYGTQLPRARGHNTLPRPPHNPYSEQNAPGEGDRLLEGRPYAKGGATDIHGQENPVPIMAAGGEYVIPPHIVHRLGGGDPNDPDAKKREKHLKQGHDMLDKWVVNERKKHVKEISKLPGPSK